MSQVDERFRLGDDEGESERTITVTGEIDLSTASALDASLRAAAADASSVVADLSEVTFLDSAGLAVLVRLHDELGGRLLLRRPSPQVSRVLSVTGIDSVIPVEP